MFCNCDTEEDSDCKRREEKTERGIRFKNQLSTIVTVIIAYALLNVYLPPELEMDWTKNCKNTFITMQRILSVFKSK